jgi:hypothetical protein
LAALSLTANSAKAATVGVTAAKVGAATKTGATLGSAGGFLPVFGCFYFIFKSNLEDAKSPREREFLMWFFWIQIASLLILMSLLSEMVFSHSWVMIKKWHGLYFSLPRSPLCSRWANMPDIIAVKFKLKTAHG